MRPPVKGQDPYGRPGQQQQRYGQQPNAQQRPGYGQPPTEQKRPQAPPAQQAGNIRADVVWALRNSGGGMSIFDISSKITSAGKPRYAETKILNILEILVRDGKVNMSEQTGRVTYKWAVEAV
jgi:hypothetical protein